MSEPNENIRSEPPSPAAPPSDAAPSAAPDASSQAPVFSDLTQDDKTMGMLCHILGAVTGFIGPLIIWLVKKDKSKFVDDQGKEALNFHITLLIGHVIGAATACVTFGGVNGIVYILGLVFGIIGGMEANKGVAYRYPFAIRLIK